MKRFTFALILGLATSHSSVAVADDAPAGWTGSGWTSAAPRDEIKPTFKWQATGGRSGQGSLVISAQSEGMAGWWQKTFDVTGGKHYRFEAWRKAEHIDTPRRAALVRVLWQDDKGQAVMHEEVSDAPYATGKKPRAEPEYPTDKSADKDGWTEVSDTYQAPPK